ncbi:hypothetical protein OF83DRAFT_62330 [Amylostereum chailletii]|nr:hypothetical protein OF83DRAFT_62330 [Amylostereum chailletii]
MGDDADAASNDYRMLLASLATLSLATTSALLWRASRPSTDSPLIPNVWSSLLSPWCRPRPPPVSDHPTDRPHHSDHLDLLDVKDSKSSRSKERRRRGKDPVKDLRKFKDPPKSSFTKRPDPPPPAPAPPLPALSKRASPSDETTPTQSPSDDPSAHGPDSHAHALAHSSVPDPPLLSVPDVLSHPARSVSSSSSSVSSSSALLPPSSSSTSSPPRSHSSRPSNKASWDWDGQSSYYPQPPPRFAAAAAAAARKLPVSTSASPIPGPSQTLHSPSSSPALSHHLLSAPLSERLLSPSPSPARPASWRAPTPSADATTSNSLSMQTQIASLKGALEASRMREEKQRAEADRLAKEYDAVRWRWHEDLGGWRRREAELQGYIQYLTQSMHLYPLASPPPSHLQTPRRDGGRRTRTGLRWRCRWARGTVQSNSVRRPFPVLSHPPSDRIPLTRPMPHAPMPPSLLTHLFILHIFRPGSPPPPLPPLLSSFSSSRSRYIPPDADAALNPRSHIDPLPPYLSVPPHASPAPSSPSPSLRAFACLPPSHPCTSTRTHARTDVSATSIRQYGHSSPYSIVIFPHAHVHLVLPSPLPSPRGLPRISHPYCSILSSPFLIPPFEPGGSTVRTVCFCALCFLVWRAADRGGEAKRRR